MNSNAQCSIYKLLKTEWGMPKYISMLSSSLRTSMCRFRTRCHNLPVSYDRFKPCDASKKLCPLCDDDVLGDEYHYIFNCKYFQEERSQLIPKKYLEKYPNFDKFVELFLDDNFETASKLAKFCRKIIKTFNREKPLTPLKVRKTHVMRSRRVSRRPGYLNDYFV